MKVLVTGSSGFLGSATVARLRLQDIKVIGIDKVPARRSVSHPDDRLVDLTDPDAVRAVLGEVRPDFVVNFAARTDISATARAVDYGANIDGVANLLAAIRETGSVRRAIWISSQLVSRIGRVQATDTDYQPDTTYGESKVISEKLVRALEGGGTEWVIARPTTVWGPGMSDHYLALLRYLERRFYFHVGSAPIYKSFSFIHNAAFQIERLLLADRGLVHGRTFYIADYEPIDLRKWCDALALALGAAPPPTVPIPVARILARLGDLLNATVTPSFKFNSVRLRNILCPYVFDVEELARLTGHLPYTFADGIRLTVDWYRKRCAAGERSSRSAPLGD
jgi:nucleoside-diphosphate-sugar epimerase